MLLFVRNQRVKPSFLCGGFLVCRFRSFGGLIRTWISEATRMAISPFTIKGCGSPGSSFSKLMQGGSGTAMLGTELIFLCWETRLVPEQVQLKNAFSRGCWRRNTGGVCMTCQFQAHHRTMSTSIFFLNRRP